MTASEAYAQFHAARLATFNAQLEKEVDRLVADGFPNSGPTRADAVYRLMAEAHDFREPEVWLAAWAACEKSQQKP
jgi:hypothetical protein